jgi:hypothetical protein
MSYRHRQLAMGGWAKLGLMEQLANVGSEVGRAIGWREKGKKGYSWRSLERALELLSLTIGDVKNRSRLKELTRLREVLLDYFYGGNVYGSTDRLWRKYFKTFGWVARRGR